MKNKNKTIANKSGSNWKCLMGFSWIYNYLCNHVYSIQHYV